MCTLKLVPALMKSIWCLYCHAEISSDEDSQQDESQLSAEHSDRLSRCAGINDAGIAARGYRTTSDVRELKVLDFSRRPLRLAPARGLGGRVAGARDGYLRVFAAGCAASAASSRRTFSLWTRSAANTYSPNVTPCSSASA